jgi:hypothetical protein
MVHIVTAQLSRVNKTNIMKFGWKRMKPENKITKKA